MSDPEEFTQFIDALDRAGLHASRKIAAEIWNMLSTKESNTIDRCAQILDAAPTMEIAKEALKKFKTGVEYVKA